MTTTNFVFLLATVTLTSFLGFWVWQYVKIQKKKRPGDEKEFKRVAEEKY